MWGTDVTNCGSEKQLIYEEGGILNWKKTKPNMNFI